MFYIFEMANNHQGSVEHAKLIVDKFAEVASETGVNAAVKLQFRQLDTFIHEDFKQSDLKFVKRFNSTRLSKEQFSEIIEHIRASGLSVVSTPFDNESLPWFAVQWHPERTSEGLGRALPREWLRKELQNVQ